ncbi:MAG: AzlD domain-containing protein [Solirubrobacteraceae bacterium]
MTALWTALIVAAVGCYLLKLAGLSLPRSALNHPAVQHTATLLPVAMLAALVAVQLFDANGRYRIDTHTLAGVGAATIALLLRQGFLVVFIVAIGVTAALRLLT